MPISPRLIRRRIKSVGNTRKITKAMELVAASKMRRATTAAGLSRRYAEAGFEMIATLAATVDRGEHPLLNERPVKRSLIILLTSHRGLAGGFNSNILRALLQFIGNQIPAGECYFITVGKKGDEALRRLGKNITASFSTIGDTHGFADAEPIAGFARGEFVSGNADRVYLAYTDFISPILLKPRIRQLLPVTAHEIADFLKENSEAAAGEIKSRETLFEPSKDFVLEQILPRMTDLQIYQALLESSASEHSARMMAMRNATDAAGEMIDDLNLTFNQARQAAITREISEIAAGKAALED